MSDVYYWWYAYGNFAPGEDNLPCTGEVIAYYLSLHGLSKRDIALHLKCTERYVEMLKNPTNKNMPQLLPRRIVLARSLHIPPILLGLSSVTLIEWGDGAEVHATGSGLDAIASKEVMLSYERLLAVSWELYYTSSVQKAASMLTSAFVTLTDESTRANGVKKDQYDAMSCRFYQLYSLVLRDRLEIDKALEAENTAVDIALRLKNAELIAASLLRRARIYIRQKEYKLAGKDALDALPYADLARDPLRGKCYQMAGEAQGYLAGTNKALQEKSLTYFNTAAQIARKGNLAPDGSFVKTDITSVYIERAEALTSFGRFAEAHNALAIARKNLSPELTRWEVNLLLAEANTYFAQQDINSCCYSLISALTIVQALSLPGKKERIQSVYQNCKNLAPNNTTVKKLEQLLPA